MKGYGRDQNMKAYGKKLWWIENQHYGDELHTGIPLPSSGKKRGQRRKRYERIFKKMERQHSKNEIRKIIKSIDNAEVYENSAYCVLFILGKDDRRMRKEAIKIKCPDRIQFGDPMYFEDYRNDPEKLQKLVVDYRPQPGFKAGVSLVETEHPEYPGFIARTMTIYFAPEQYLSIYMDGKMYASQKIDRKEIGVVRHAI